MSTKLDDIKDIYVVAGITSPTAAIATNVTGPALDLVTSDGKCFALQIVGDITGVAVGLAGKMQESPSTTAASFTDISGATFTALTGFSTGIGGLQAIQFIRSQRYVRYVANVTGTTIVSATTTTVMAISLDFIVQAQRKQI